MTNLSRHRRVLAALVLGLGAAAALPAQDADRTVAVHVGRLIENGKIEAIGPKMELPFPCEEVDARHLTAMPGLIQPQSRLGLLNYNRGGLQGHRRVADEFLPEPKAYRDALEAGYTTLVLVPGGNSGIPGRSMVIRTADVGQGFVVEEEGYLGLFLRNPSSDKRLLRDAFQNAQKEIEKVQKAREEWDKKQAEAAKKAAEEAEKKKQEEKPKEGDGKAAQEPPRPEPPKEGEKKEEQKPEEFKPPAIRPELQPLVDLIEKKGGARALIEIGSASTYLHLRDALQKVEIPHALASDTGSAGRFSVVDLFFVKKELGENKETVLVAPTLVTYPYSINQVNLPWELVEAGATVGFAPFSDNAATLQAMRWSVGQVIRGGMDRNAAIQAMTLHVAEAVGLADRMGSVEKGKDGNLVLLSGDPFDVQTRVEQVLIEGTVVYERDENGR